MPADLVAELETVKAGLLDDTLDTGWETFLASLPQ